MEMRLAVADRPTLLYVAERMREWDRREIYATRWTEGPSALADSLLAPHNIAWIAGIEEPIAALGAYPAWPGVWSVWMFATDNFPQIGYPLTKFIKKRMIPTLASHAHRAECRSIEGHEAAHRWLENLGAEREATLRGFGRNGETFHLYRWLRTDDGISSLHSRSS